MADEAVQEKRQGDSGYCGFSHTFYDRFRGEDVEFSFFFRRPSTPQVSRVQKGLLKNTGQAMRNLVLDVVDPGQKAELKAALEQYPGLSNTFGGALLASVGFGDLGNE